MEKFKKVGVNMPFGFTNEAKMVINVVLAGVLATLWGYIAGLNSESSTDIGIILLMFILWLCYLRMGDILWG